MNQICKATAIAIAAASAADAFVTGPNSARTHLPATWAANTFVGTTHTPHRLPASTQLYGTEADDTAQDNEIERLKQMAAKLRAEAATLEADKAKQLAEAAEKAFRKFDVNSKGEISLSELKAGLEKELKVGTSLE